MYIVYCCLSTQIKTAAAVCDVIGPSCRSSTLTITFHHSQHPASCVRTVSTPLLCQVHCGLHAFLSLVATFSVSVLSLCSKAKQGCVIAGTSAQLPTVFWNALLLQTSRSNILALSLRNFYLRTSYRYCSKLQLLSK